MKVLAKNVKIGRVVAEELYCCLKLQSKVLMADHELGKTIGSQHNKLQLVLNTSIKNVKTSVASNSQYSTGIHNNQLEQSKTIQTPEQSTENH